MVMNVSCRISVLHAISLRNVRTLASYARDVIGVKSIEQEEYVHVRVSHGGSLASSDSLKKSLSLSKGTLAVATFV